MKRKILLLFTIFLAAIAMHSCIDTSTFDPTLLIGKWSRPSPFATEESPGNEFYRYFEGGTGSTWDTSEDVTEEEAQQFTWHISGSTLTLVHEIEMGGFVSKIYTLSTLTNTTLIYKDDFGKTYSFHKVY